MEVGNCSCPTSHTRISCNNGCLENKIRLVNGYTENDGEGRVEACVDGRWGTVQTSQPRELANKSCRIHNKGLVYFSNCLGTQYGYRQSKPVRYCDVNTGSCSEGGTDDHNADLGVVCGSPLDEDECFVNGQFRLNDVSEGRLEVCVDGRWGTVCNSSQEGIAGAVCSQVGFPEGVIPGTGPQVPSEIGRKSYYCYSNSTCVETCCDHPTSLTVKCLTVISTEGPNDLIIPAVVAVLAVLVVLVVAVVICLNVVIVRRRRLKQSPPGTSAQMNEKHRSESYSLKQINSQVYNVATSTPNYTVQNL